MKDTVFVIALIALVAISGFQAFEISELKSVGVQSVLAEPVEETQAPEKSPTSGEYQLPDNLEGLKTMVGGC